MRRTIDGFHQDDDGEWVAELSCLHGQHVRHRPPFQERPWVLGEAGRARCPAQTSRSLRSAATSTAAS